MKLSILLKQLQAELLYRSGLLNPLPGSWRILMYHRITTPEEVPYPIEPGMYVTPKTFGMHLEFLKQNFEVILVDELCARVSAGNTSNRPLVAITFDDGLADNYRYALSALTKHQLPATVFLATSYIGTSRLFWSDALQALLGSGGDLSAVKQILQANSLETLAPKLEQIPSDPSGRRELGSTITRAIKSSARSTRDKIIAELTPHLTTQEQRVPRQFLTWEEAQEMGRHNVTFGSHTHTHSYLPDLTPEQLHNEINESLRLIQEHQLPQSSVFCYPGGYFNENTQRLLATHPFSATLLTDRTLPNATPPAFPRRGLHEDMSSTAAMLARRIAESTR